MLLALLITAGGYGLLIALHVRVIRRHRVRGAYEPRVARWIAARLGPLPEPAPAGGRLAHREAVTVRRLFTGDLDPAAYRAAMADVAAQESFEHASRPRS